MLVPEAMRYPRLENLSLKWSTWTSHGSPQERIGAQPFGRIIRLQYSSSWREAQGQVAALTQEAGFEVREDAVSSVFGKLTGSDNGPSILIGSHVDTVAYGGPFDGVFGVLQFVGG